MSDKDIFDEPDCGERAWKKGDDAGYNEITERKWRAAVVLKLEGRDGVHILYTDLAGHVDEKHCNVCLLRARATFEGADLERLQPMWVELHKDPRLAEARRRSRTEPRLGI